MQGQPMLEGFPCLPLLLPGVSGPHSLFLTWTFVSFFQHPNLYIQDPGIHLVPESWDTWMIEIEKAI